MSIAILLATYNSKRYLHELLDSLFSQTINDFICYIHDDGSSDDTVSILEEYKEQYPDQITILPGPPTGGPKNNFFYIMNMVKDTNIDYYFLSDQDDVWAPDKISVMMKRMHEIENADFPCVLFTDMKVVDEKLNEIAPSFFDYIGADRSRIRPNQLIIQSFIAGCSMLINKRALEIATLVQDANNIFMHDWWIALIASYTGILMCMDERLVLYRQHGNNSVGASQYKLKTFLTHLFQTIFGNHKADIRDRIERPRRFANELRNIPNLSDEQEAFLTALADIGSKNKVERVVFYVKNKLFRNNHRNILMLLYV